jgi:NAD(P)H-quinone oxidoreductase subunit M
MATRMATLRNTGNHIGRPPTGGGGGRSGDPIGPASVWRRGTVPKVLGEQGQALRPFRLFTARVENGDLVPDDSQLTLDIDPDNEFLWEESSLEKVRNRFGELVNAQAGADLTDYTLRRIGSELEGLIRQLLQAGDLRYNPDSRVLNYSMGLPRTPETL